MYKPGSYGDKYDDDRYGSRDEDRNGYGYGREREAGNRDDDRYGRYGDSNSRDGDRYGRDYEERDNRDGYKDDDYRGRSRSVDDFQYGSRSRSSDRDRDRAFDDDAQYSSRYASISRGIYVASVIKNHVDFHDFIFFLPSHFAVFTCFFGWFSFHLSIEEAILASKNAN